MSGDSINKRAYLLSALDSFREYITAIWWVSSRACVGAERGAVLHRQSGLCSGATNWRADLDLAVRDCSSHHAPVVCYTGTHEVGLCEGPARGAERGAVPHGRPVSSHHEPHMCKTIFRFRTVNQLRHHGR